MLYQISQILIISFCVLVSSCAKEQVFDCDTIGNSGNICSKTIQLNGTIHGYETFFYSGDFVTDIVRYDSRRRFLGKVIYQYNSDGLIIKESHLNSKRELVINDLYTYNSVLKVEKKDINNVTTKYAYNEFNRLKSVSRYRNLELQSIDSLIYYANDSVYRVYSYNGDFNLISFVENSYFSNGIKKSNYFDSNNKLHLKETRVYDDSQIQIFEQSDDLDNLLKKQVFFYKNGHLSNIIIEDYLGNLTREEIFKIIE